MRSRVFSGAAAEVGQVVAAMNDLKAMVGTHEFLMVADSKPVSHSNIVALLESGVEFIAPVPAAQIKDEV
ncbi:hypothetical protein ACFVYP_28435 [Kitasatospora sp. NPDC058201]|uniref:hypothetical protein n=1 Tax=unclassified Kitasatospora TaxID=2633591 RepID=UPI003668B868